MFVQEGDRNNLYTVFKRLLILMQPVLSNPSRLLSRCRFRRCRYWKKQDEQHAQYPAAFSYAEHPSSLFVHLHLLGYILLYLSSQNHWL